MDSSQILEAVTLQSHFRARPLRNLGKVKNDPIWNSMFPDGKTRSEIVDMPSRPPAESKMEVEEDDEDEILTADLNSWGTSHIKKKKPRQMTCYGRGFPRTPFSELPDFANIEEAEREIIMLEASGKSRGRGRGRMRVRGAGSVSTQARNASDANWRKIREQGRELFGNQKPPSPDRKPIRCPRSQSIIGNNFEASNELSSSSSALPNVTSSSSRSSTRSSLASSLYEEPAAKEPVPHINSNFELPNFSSVPSQLTNNSGSANLRGRSCHSSFSSIKSSLQSDPSEEFCTPEDVPLPGDNRLQLDEIMTVDKLANNFECSLNLASSALHTESETLIGSNRSSPVPSSEKRNSCKSSVSSTVPHADRETLVRSESSSPAPSSQKKKNKCGSPKSNMNGSSTVPVTKSESLIQSKCLSSLPSSQKKTNNCGSIKSSQTDFSPNIIHTAFSSSNSSQEENYERSNIYVHDSPPKWDPFAPKNKGPNSWKMDDFPQLKQSSNACDTTEKPSVKKAPNNEELSLKSIGNSLVAKNILEPVSDLEDSDSRSSSGEMQLVEFLKIMNETESKPETLLISNIPGHVTKNEITELISSYNGTVSSVNVSPSGDFQSAEIKLSKCDGNYLVDCLNGSSPFGGAFEIKCELL